MSSDRLQQHHQQQHHPKPGSLYELCLNAAVADCVGVCKSCQKDFILLPDNVLFDFYYKIYTVKMFRFLGHEFSKLDVFKRLLNLNHKRIKLLKCYQGLIEYESIGPNELINNYIRLTTERLNALNGDGENNDVDAVRSKDTASSLCDNVVDLGLKLGAFLSEGGWYCSAITVLDEVEGILIKTRVNDVKTNRSDKDVPETDPTRKTDEIRRLYKLLDCYHKRIYAESEFCLFQKAETTYKLANEVIEKLRRSNALPNLASVYANYSKYYFEKNEYDEAYKWTQEAIKLLNDDLPVRSIINVLRQGSKSCVLKRRFQQAGLLIDQALTLSSQTNESPEVHPQHADVLMDYGFYLLNYDSIQGSIEAYERALEIRKRIFEKHNINVAIGFEDLAYASYVNEYSSGDFYLARESVDRAIRIMEKILPKQHQLLASAKRVKALILEEIALDMIEASNPGVTHKLLDEADILHTEALNLSLESFGENNVLTAKHYGNLGRLYQSMRLYYKSEEMHLKAITIKEQLLGPNDYEVGLSLGHLASLYNYSMHKHKEAEELYLRTIKISLNLFGDTYSGLEYDYRGLIRVYSELNDIENMMKYTQIMRRWTSMRKKQQNAPQKPIKREREALTEIVRKFLSLC